MSSQKILLTGFEPFKQETVNPSKEIVLAIGPKQGIGHLILPVSYQRSVQILEKALHENPYDFVLMLGEAGKRANIGLERNAVNRINATIADEDGVASSERKISASGPELFQNHLNLDQWAQAMREENFPVEVSESAGTYVCNHLYYRVSEILHRTKSSTKALFVHVPYLPEQTENKAPGTPSLPSETMTAAIESLLQKIENA